MSAREHAQLDELLADRDVLSVTRRDPGNTGPLIVSCADGSELELEEGD